MIYYASLSEQMRSTSSQEMDAIEARVKTDKACLVGRYTGPEKLAFVDVAASFMWSTASDSISFQYDLSLILILGVPASASDAAAAVTTVLLQMSSC